MQGNKMTFFSKGKRKKTLVESISEQWEDKFKEGTQLKRFLLFLYDFAKKSISSESFF